MKSYAKIPSFVGVQHRTAVETKKHLHCLNLWLSSWGAFSKILFKLYVLKQNTFYSINPAIAPMKMNLHLTLQGALVFKHKLTVNLTDEIWAPMKKERFIDFIMSEIWLSMTIFHCNHFRRYIHHSANMSELKCTYCHLFHPLDGKTEHNLFCLRESWPR